MFRVSQHPSSGVLKTVIAASGTGHNIGPATSFQRATAIDHRTATRLIQKFPAFYNSQNVHCCVYIHPGKKLSHILGLII